MNYGEQNYATDNTDHKGKASVGNDEIGKNYDAPNFMSFELINIISFPYVKNLGSLVLTI